LDTAANSDRTALFDRIAEVDPLVDTSAEAEAAFGGCSDQELESIIGYYGCLLEQDDPEVCGDLAILADACADPYVAMLAAAEPLSASECAASIQGAMVASASYYPDAETEHLPAGLSVAHRFAGEGDGGFAFIAIESDSAVCHLGLRGTDNGTDVSVDLKSYMTTACAVSDTVTLGQCGSGFLSHFKSLAKVGMLDTLAAMVDAGECKAGLRISGHSLGGALSSLVSAYLYETDPETFTMDYMKVHTFGEPRLLGDDSADSYQGLIAKLRWLNYGDPVPSAIGSTLGFRHFGEARLISSSNSFWGSASYSYLAKEQDFTTYNLGPATVYRHKVSSYIDRLSHCE
jgi:hypothetical protein